MASISKLTAEAHEATTHLDFASCLHNQISHINSLLRFSSLMVLSIPHQLISRIENLPPTLTHLNLEFNQIQTIENISHLSLLEQLLLTSNVIYRLCDFSQLRSLRVLELAHNRLETESLSFLSTCREVSVLSLQGNPLVESIDYRVLVGLAVSSVAVLDSEPLKKTNIVLGDYNLYKSILQESIHEKEVILKEAQKLKIEAKHRELEDGNVIKIVQNKIHLIQIENVGIIEQINISKGRAEELEVQYQRSRSEDGQEDSLLGMIESKYQESLWLQHELKKLEQLPNPTLQQQKTRNSLLERLIRNQENLESYQKELKHIRSEQVLSEKDQCTTEERVSSQLSTLHSYVASLHKRLRSNQSLIVDYQNSLNPQSYQTAEMVSHLRRLIFGEERELAMDTIQSMCEKYPGGLLNMLHDLAGIIFGNEPNKQKIQQLKEALGGKALLDWFCEKNLSQKRKTKFLEEKETFILQFERETEDLLENWLQLKKAEDRHCRRVKHQREKQERGEEELKLRMKTLMSEHSETMCRELKEHTRALNAIQGELSNLRAEKARLQGERMQLQQYKQSTFNAERDLEKLSRQIRGRKLDVQSWGQKLQKITSDYRQCQSRYQSMMQGCSQKQNELLSLEAQHRMVANKLATANNDYSLKKEQVSILKLELSQLQALVLGEEKALHRSKAGVLMMEDQLDNLTKLSGSKRSMIECFEKELTRLSQVTEITKKKSASSVSSEELLLQASVGKNRHTEY